ncbi:glucose-1-phosphate adenylyltransferase [Butyricicoccus sp. Marseille-Q5471]|uniref:glucose-1-phosphate adenylyltransferase n=1 Tax=Butyricicoccus sp. Marseille-Q5471 TaxID=3039493 RepID=UPI0024BD2356|nr:glucose-1-phosphate adenylyltransferase [Butyricicoccus sp. Marseille-Q5471]
MYRKKECVAMLLAGGQGSRLYVLTTNVAKPAVPFGGKYRIIDFPLSNCTNSGIDTVGVLTQYEPHALNAYVGAGQTWDLDRLRGGVYILPPYQKGKASEWYKGTANAIYQNIQFLDEYDPEYVLILSGDHIYKMNYNTMLKQHKKTGADATIAVLDVPLAEASRFGIMNCNPDGTIYEFEEKPKNPKSTLASMGIYIFSWKKLRQYLIDDEGNKKSSNDFGKDIIPAMLGAGEKLVSYRFDGYWKDVGTIESLWEANMDLLSPNSGLNLSDDNWKIYGRNNGAPPHFTTKDAVIKHALISEGCEIAGEVAESVLFSDVRVAKGAKVEYSILMPGAVIEQGAVVRYSIVAENAIIARDAVVGGCPTDGDVDKWGVSVVASGVRIGRGAKLAAKEMADQDLPDKI